MKKIMCIAVMALVFTSCSRNQHLRFKNGVVISENRGSVDVSVSVDTSFDGVADIEATVMGFNNTNKDYKRNDTVSVDVRTKTSYAEPVLH